MEEYFLNSPSTQPPEVAPLQSCHARRTTRGRIWQTLGVALIFGVAMGLLEAICVIYLRHLLSPSENPVAALNRFPVEQIREASTLVMLLTVAWLAGFNARTRLAYFSLLFGIWDITYYVGLKWLAHWPTSWLEWDTLFLIPVPWYGPVLSVLLISAYLVGACVLCVLREDRGAPLRWRPLSLLLQMAALGFWYYSFTSDSATIRAHGHAGVSYPWTLLACGLLCGCFSMFLAMRAGADKRAPNAPSRSPA